MVFPEPSDEELEKAWEALTAPMSVNYKGMKINLITNPPVSKGKWMMMARGIDYPFGIAKDGKIVMPHLGIY